jgi:hypothetical protein
VIERHILIQDSKFQVLVLASASDRCPLRFTQTEAIFRSIAQGMTSILCSALVIPDETRAGLRGFIHGHLFARKR